MKRRRLGPVLWWLAWVAIIALGTWLLEASRVR